MLHLLKLIVYSTGPVKRSVVKNVYCNIYLFSELTWPGIELSATPAQTDSTADPVNTSVVEMCTVIYIYLWLN